jgi:hypothetical protein
MDPDLKSFAQVEVYGRIVAAYSIIETDICACFFVEFKPQPRAGGRVPEGEFHIIGLGNGVYVCK